MLRRCFSGILKRTPGTPKHFWMLLGPNDPARYFLGQEPTFDSAPRQALHRTPHLVRPATQPGSFLGLLGPRGPVVVVFVRAHEPDTHFRHPSLVAWCELSSPQATDLGINRNEPQPPNSPNKSVALAATRYSIAFPIQLYFSFLDKSPLSLSNSTFLDKRGGVGAAAPRTLFTRYTSLY